MIQNYRYLWPNCSDILAPLMELTKGGPAKKRPHRMDYSIHQGISTNGITHRHRDHPRLSIFLKKIHDTHRHIGRKTDHSNHASR